MHISLRKANRRQTGGRSGSTEEHAHNFWALFYATHMPDLAMKDSESPSGTKSQQKTILWGPKTRNISTRAALFQPNIAEGNHGSGPVHAS